ncbi:MAG: TetR/AcrR family transcriptional regulator [Cyanobacteria bacterium P01_D01_bin.44]
MPRDGTATKTRILDAAEALIMGHGLTGTSIDQVLAKAGVTKGAFFYHFKSKADLARALIERYAAQDEAHLDALLKQVETVSSDPLQQILSFLDLLVADAEKLIEPGAGCLIASFVSQFEAVDPVIREISARSFLHWQQSLGAKFEAVITEHPPRFDVSAEDLVNGVISTYEGALVLIRVLQDTSHLFRQFAQYRQYIELLFMPE